MATGVPLELATTQPGNSERTFLPGACGGISSQLVPFRAILLQPLDQHPRMCSADLTQTAASPQGQRGPRKRAVTASPGLMLTPVTMEATSADLAQLRTDCWSAPGTEDLLLWTLACNNHRQSGMSASSATRLIRPALPARSPVHATQRGQWTSLKTSPGGQRPPTQPLSINAKKVLGFKTKPGELFTLYARGPRATGPL